MMKLKNASCPLLRFPVARFSFLIFLISNFLFPACNPNPYREGERLYKRNCANCHMDDGKGLSGLIPPLAGADYLEKNREKLPCIVKYGIKDSIIVNGKIYAEQMPGVETLSDIHITNVLNYINNSWGNRAEPYRLEEVQKFLKDCQPARK